MVIFGIPAPLTELDTFPLRVTVLGSTVKLTDLLGPIVTVCWVTPVKQVPGAMETRYVPAFKLPIEKNPLKPVEVNPLLGPDTLTGILGYPPYGSLAHPGHLMLPEIIKVAAYAAGGLIKFKDCSSERVWEGWEKSENIWIQVSSRDNKMGILEGYTSSERVSIMQLMIMVSFLGR